MFTIARKIEEDKRKKRAFHSRHSCSVYFIENIKEEERQSYSEQEREKEKKKEKENRKSNQFIVYTID
jgi:hypothetical protein